MADHARDAFQRALDEAASNDRAPDDRRSRSAGGLRMRGLAFGAAPGSGGKARFGLALDWTDELPDPAPPAQPQPPRPPGRSGDPSAEVATDSGLAQR
jgi:hypothetical protein